MNFFLELGNSLINLNLINKLDAAENWQFGFQDPASPIMEGIISFHNDDVFRYFYYVFSIMGFISII